MGILHRVRAWSRGSPERWLAETRILNRLGYVPPPVAVQWISTSACDLTCPHCYSEAGRRSHAELTTDEAKRLIVDEMVRLGCPLLVIAGGEALLRKDLPEIVAYAHGRGLSWSLHSHGGRVEGMADLFRQYPPALAAISLDGPPAYHDSFRGRAGAFEGAMAAIRTLRAAGCREVVAGTTVNRQNADLLADLFPYIRDSGARSWGLHLMTPEGRAGRHSELLPTQRQLRRAAAYARRLRSFFRVELDNEWGSAGNEDAFYRETKFVCGAGRFTCVVAASGEVVPCTTTDLREAAGNVRQRPLSEIWAGGFRAFRLPGDPLRGDPFDCWLQTRHGVSCRAPAFRTDLFDSSAGVSL